jgi:hypothetical protein
MIVDMLAAPGLLLAYVVVFKEMVVGHRWLPRGLPAFLRKTPPQPLEVMPPLSIGDWPVHGTENAIPTP